MNTKRFVFAIICIFLMTCGFQCTVTDKTTIGDGKVDELESATIRVAVGLALTAKPELVPISYSVSSALLDVIGSDISSANTNALDIALNRQLAKLNLDAATKASFNDLVNLVKVKIKEQFNASDISQSNKVIVIRDILNIIQQTSLSRMTVVK